MAVNTTSRPESFRPALALIPLVIGRRRIGNLVLSHSAIHVWTEPELQVFRAAANQIAAALDNARRFQREQERTERLALLARVGQGIAFRLNPGELLAIPSICCTAGWATITRPCFC
jgi:GAF domain-containing protein